MWFSFWRSRDRFSLEELRYLTDQLQKVQVVNEVSKDFVIEALRSISELITYGDQHDPRFFEFFMEKQVMGEFVRILKISRTVTVALQLLQTVSIMIQNLKSEQAIYYMFSNEHINYFITYSFDFRNEELLSYYISFLRATSGKLNKNIISLLVKTQNDEVVSFPLYVEAIRFAFHEESMIRTAIRALTLNVYHVGDDAVNRYVARTPHSDYFSNLVLFFRNQCIGLNSLVSDATKSPVTESISAVVIAVDEIEDNLYYFSDVISAGIPDVGRLITDNILQHLIFPLLLPSLRMDAVSEKQIGVVTSLYILCCILRIVKIKDLANTMAAALFFPLEAFVPFSEVKRNGYMSGHDFTDKCLKPDNDRHTSEVGSDSLSLSNSSSSSENCPKDVIMRHKSGPRLALREALLSFVTGGDDVLVLGSLSVLATLLQTKELDESMLDALGILPQRKQHKKLLLQALVGEGSDEDQLFSLENSSVRDDISNELDCYLQKLKDQYGVEYSQPEVGASPRVHRFQVLDALVSLFCRSNISADTLWDGGWLLRQLLPYSEAEFNNHHLDLFKNSYKNCTASLIQEVRGIWPDLLITVLCDEWKKCKRVIEASSPRKEPKCMLLQSKNSFFEGLERTHQTLPNLVYGGENKEVLCVMAIYCEYYDGRRAFRFLGSPSLTFNQCIPVLVEGLPDESSFTAGERMLELVKVFVLLHQLQIFSLGRALPEQPPIHPPIDLLDNCRAISTGLDVSGPKPGTELRLVNAVPCRVAFERGKERHFCFLAISMGISGWVILAEELPLKPLRGVVRVTAPLAGSRPKIDEKHSRWLHLRIRPSTLPFLDPAKSGAYNKVKTKALVDGRWTLAFRDEESCKSALSMILEESNLQSNEVERRLTALLDLERSIDLSNPSQCSPEVCSSRTASSNSF